MADRYRYDAPYAEQHAAWDGHAFWRGAGDDIASRIDFMQNRINDAAADGRLSGYDAHRFSRSLADIRRDAWRSRGMMTPEQRTNIQWRLDNLASRIRWDKRAADGGMGDSRHYVTSYDAARDYRDDPRYRERPLSANDHIYRGSDGRVYCKRGDGSTGLVIGAVGGAAIGNVISDRHDRAASTLLGGALGALVGQQVDANSSVRCR
jgi:hypothetical protein